MNLFEKILYALEEDMERPGNYGWFHLMFFAITIAITVFLCIRFKNVSDNTFRRIMCVAWIIMVALEIYKQLIFSFEHEGGVTTWDYLWYAFPYQLCSTPMYVLPFIAFMKDCKFRDACISYMSVFSFFGGLAVFFYPNDVFTETIGINIQTMVHHGSQIALGIYGVCYNRNKISEFKYHLRSVPVFSVLTAVAVIMNIVGYHALRAGGMDDTFNMFYISPYFDCTLPILSMIYPKVPFLAFILIYIFGFVVIATILYSLERLVVQLIMKNKKDKNDGEKISALNQEAKALL